jgi:hypothetical protein
MIQSHPLSPGHPQLYAPAILLFPLTCLIWLALKSQLRQVIFPWSRNVHSFPKNHGHMARGGHGLPKLILWPNPMAHPSMPYYTLWVVSRMPNPEAAHRADVLLPFPTPLDTPGCMPMRLLYLQPVVCHYVIADPPFGISWSTVWR